MPTDTPELTEGELDDFEESLSFQLRIDDKEVVYISPRAYRRLISAARRCLSAERELAEAKEIVRGALNDFHEETQSWTKRACKLLGRELPVTLGSIRAELNASHELRDGLAEKLMGAERDLATVKAERDGLRARVGEPCVARPLRGDRKDTVVYLRDGTRVELKRAAPSLAWLEVRGQARIVPTEKP